MKFFKKLLCVFGITLIGFNTNAYSIEPPPDIKSESFILLDYETGKVLFNKNDEEILSPASLTKMMTVYVVFKSIQNGVITKDDTLKVSKNAVLSSRKDSSRTFLEINDIVPITDVLKGLIVQSGNDSAIALAEKVSGSEENFAHLMNTYAKQLGMNNSNFVNASGLPAKDHYSTAKDLSILMRALIKEFPDEYHYYFSIKSFEYNNISQKSRNQLLFSDPDFEGGKTGWHSKAQYCYMASVVKNGRRLIVVTLKSPTSNGRFADAVSLSNYGYQFFENYFLTEKNKPLNGLASLLVYKGEKDSVGIVPESDIILTIQNSNKNNIKSSVFYNAPIFAPVKKGDVLGYVIVEDNEKNVIAKTNLIANEDVLEGDFFKKLSDSIFMMIKK